eukprot:697166-Rhodomonas_salina.1
MQAKASSLADKAAALLADPRVTPWDVSRFRRKLFWYCPCIPGVKVLTCSLNAYIGTPADDQWDVHKPLNDVAKDELDFLVSTLLTLAEITKPMSPPALSLLLQRFVLGHPSVDFVWSNDAVVKGYGAVFRALMGIAEPPSEAATR